MSDAPPFRGSSSPFTRQQLRAQRFRRVSRDVYVHSSALQSLELAADAALLGVSDAVLSHTTAASLLGLPVDVDRVVHLTRRARASTSVRQGVRTHRSDLPPDDVVVHRGRTVTSPARTWTDLAATLALDPLVVLGDAVARRDGTEALVTALQRAGGRRGVVRARQALPLVDPGSESPGETRTRLVLHAAGLTGMRHGVRVLDERGQWLATPDLADRDARVAVQYDGLVHLDRGARRRQADVDRDELTRAAGWEVVVLTARDLRHPEGAVHKVRAAYARAATRRRP